MDTFCEHLRATDVNYTDRKKIINTCLTTFLSLVSTKNICIVLVNNMKTGKKEFLGETQDQRLPIL